MPKVPTWLRTLNAKVPNTPRLWCNVANGSWDHQPNFLAGLVTLVVVTTEPPHLLQYPPSKHPRHQNPMPNCPLRRSNPLPKQYHVEYGKDHWEQVWPLMQKMREFQHLKPMPNWLMNCAK